MSRHLVPAVALLAALAPAMAHAETNIDAGKTPAQIFASDCAACHKAVRGLANGRGSRALAGFLSEHYTSSQEEAAALAAYILGGGGESGTAVQERGHKPRPEHAGAVEEPKPSTRQARRPAKPEEETPATAKLQRPADEEAKPDERGAIEAPAAAGPAARPAAGGHEPGSKTAPRGRQKQIGAVSANREPAVVVAAPEPRETPSRDVSPTAVPGPSAAAPADVPQDDASPVPRDNIPD